MLKVVNDKANKFENTVRYHLDFYSIMSTNQKISGLIPSYSTLNVELSMGKILNTGLSLMHPCECVCDC